MLRARRLACAVVAASLALGGLSACRSEPAVAAYIGSAKVSEQEVQQAWDEVYDVLKADAVQAAAAAEKQQRDEEKQQEAAGADVKPAPSVRPEPVQMPFSRADVVHAFVLREIYGRMAETRGTAVPTQWPYQEAAAQTKLPADSRYLRLYVENSILSNQLRETIKAPAQPTEADMRAVYDVLVANSDDSASVPDFSTFSSTMVPQNRQLIAGAAAMRDEMYEAAEELRVDVNPRYQPFQEVMLDSGGQGAVALLKAEFGADQRVPVADVP